MIYVAVGALGFLAIYTLDIVALKRIPRAKPFTWIPGIGLIVCALAIICLQSDKMSLPVWTTWLGWVLFSLSLSLLLCCLFVNLPFRKTYITLGVSDKLITTGLYALVRHPGVLCLTFLLISIVLVSKSSLLLIASPIWISLDVLGATIEDRFLFGKMFDGYDSYRRRTPMLLPTRRSAKAFISSLQQDTA